MKNTDLNIGPYFWINNKLIFNKCSLSEGRKQFDKIDNSYAHEKLYDDYFKVGDYIDYPREKLYERINKRIDIMVKNGVLDEAKMLNMIF